MNKKLLTGLLFYCTCTAFGANATLKYSVTPKVISATGVESPLDAFTVTGIADTFSEYKATVATGTANTALPIVTNTRIVEFQSDYAVTLGVWTAGGVFVSSFTNCTNLILNANTNYIYKVTISSTATTAKIKFRQGK